MVLKLFLVSYLDSNPTKDADRLSLGAPNQPGVFHMWYNSGWKPDKYLERYRCSFEVHNESELVFYMNLISVQCWSCCDILSCYYMQVFATVLLCFVHVRFGVARPVNHSNILHGYIMSLTFSIGNKPCKIRVTRFLPHQHKRKESSKFIGFPLRYVLSWDIKNKKIKALSSMPI